MKNKRNFGIFYKYFEVTVKSLGFKSVLNFLKEANEFNVSRYKIHIDNFYKEAHFMNRKIGDIFWVNIEDFLLSRDKNNYSVVDKMKQYYEYEKQLLSILKKRMFPLEKETNLVKVTPLFFWEVFTNVLLKSESKLHKASIGGNMINNIFHSNNEQNNVRVVNWIRPVSFLIVLPIDLNDINSDFFKSLSILEIKTLSDPNMYYSEEYNNSIFLINSSDVNGYTFGKIKTNKDEGKLIYEIKTYKNKQRPVLTYKEPLIIGIVAGDYHVNSY